MAEMMFWLSTCDDGLGSVSVSKNDSTYAFADSGLERALQCTASVTLSRRSVWGLAQLGRTANIMGNQAPEGHIIDNPVGKVN